AQPRSGSAGLACAGEVPGAPKRGPAPGALFPPPPKMPGPSPNRRDQQNGYGDGIIAVAVPQLLELFPTDFLVDFLKDVGHERPRQPRARTHPPERGGLPYRCGTGKAKPDRGRYLQPIEEPGYFGFFRSG